MGLLFQERFAQLSEEDQASFKDWFGSFALELYKNECAYSEELYDDLGLTHEVKKFVRYNFNVTCDNLGFPRMFADEEINPVVLNGITARNTTHDFFSSKGNSYQKISAAPLTDAAVQEAWNV